MDSVLVRPHSEYAVQFCSQIAKTLNYLREYRSCIISLVRPRLEYAVQFFSPNYKGIEIFERVKTLYSFLVGLHTEYVVQFCSQIRGTLDCVREYRPCILISKTTPGICSVFFLIAWTMNYLRVYRPCILVSKTSPGIRSAVLVSNYRTLNYLREYSVLVRPSLKYAVQVFLPNYKDIELRGSV